MTKAILTSFAISAFAVTASAQTTPTARETDQTQSTTTRAVQPNGNPDMDQLPAEDAGTPDMDLPGMRTVEGTTSKTETAPLEQGFTVDEMPAAPSEYGTKPASTTTTTATGMDTEEPEDGLSDDLPFLDDSDDPNDKELFEDGAVRDAEEMNNTDGIRSDDSGEKVINRAEEIGDTIVEETEDAAAQATKNGTVKAANATEEGLEDAAEATEDGVVKAAKATKNGTVKAANATGRTVKKAAKATKDAVTPDGNQ